MSETSPFIVDADWLQENLHRPGLSIVDASWYLPAQRRDAKADYDAAHIPGAIFFDQDLVVDPASSLPHTLPKPALFARFAGSMGISADDTIVVYDGPGLFSAPRVWWMFRIMGVRRSSSSTAASTAGRRRAAGDGLQPTRIAPCVFHAEFDAERVVSFAEMRDIVASGSAQVADARPAGRFAGIDPEPRAGVRGGHMPGADRTCRRRRCRRTEAAAAEAS